MEEQLNHRYLKKSRLLKFCCVPATSAASSMGILESCLRKHDMFTVQATGLVKLMLEVAKISHYSTSMFKIF